MITKDIYLKLKELVVKSGYDNEINWANNIECPNNSIDFFCEYGWVVCNSGMKNQIAKIIWEKIIDSIINKGKASDVFNHKGKSQAIDNMWNKKDEFYNNFLKYKSVDDILNFCESLPFIGNITKFHLAKNLGAPVAKPDRWLVRLSKLSNETVQKLCERLSKETNDKVVVVDTILWRACNLGFCNDLI